MTKYFLTVFLVSLAMSVPAFAQTTSFTYQGRLTASSTPANGQYDMLFKLFDTPGGATETQYGPEVSLTAVQVTNGIFTVQLDFGAAAPCPQCFDGTDRYLGISIRPAGSTGVHTNLGPRPRITSAPYAIRSSQAENANTATNAHTATDATQLGGLAAANYQQTNGDGSQLTNVNASYLGGYPATNYLRTNGDGSQLTNVNASYLGGYPATNYLRTNGDASQLTNVNASNISSGTLSDARLSSNVATLSGAQMFSGAKAFAGGISGNGSQLTNLNASNISSGTLSDTMLSFNVATLSGVQTFSGAKTFAGGISGVGSQLTNLNASNAASGTLSDARLSSNVALRNAANTFTADQTINANLTQTGTTTSLILSNGFVTSGTFGSGAITASGLGTRMMFFPGKAAFRAGSVNGNQWDNASIGSYSTATGWNIIASGQASTAMGADTTASGDYSTAMGKFTIASGSFSTGMGIDTKASGDQSTAMGSGTTASGQSSTAMGSRTTASGPFSTAMGSDASTFGFSGSFVYGDSTVSAIQLNASAANQWTIRASGGYRFFTDPFLSTGVTLSANGGAWNSVSDRNVKDNINPVSPREILKGVLSLPISTWNYKGQPQFRHIGAMAQDFYSTFNVGESDKTITTVDPDGVALAAIQGLNEELKDRDKKIEQQQLQLNSLQEQLKQQQTAVTGLKKLVCFQNPQAEVCKEDK